MNINFISFKQDTSKKTIKKCLFFLFCFFNLFFCQLEALNRDYRNDCDEDNQFQNYYKPFCLDHVPETFPDISSDLIYLIPETGPKCSKCNYRSCYLGYIDVDYRKYLSHLKHHLEYTNQNSDCFCLWVEHSQEAAHISDTAYVLFRDLISTTALSHLLENESEQREFINNPGWFFNRHGLTLSFIIQQFRFSNYYHVCQDVKNYAVAKYNERESAKIIDKLQDILTILYPKFFNLYASCYKEHPSEDIKQEIHFMKLLFNDLSALEATTALTETTNSMLEKFNESSSAIIKVHATFTTYVETNSTFLTDAWVVTKK